MDAQKLQELKLLVQRRKANMLPDLIVFLLIMQDPKAILTDGQVTGIHSIVELENKLNAGSRTSCLLIMYFTATRCGSCRYISVHTSLAGKYPKVVFLKVDIDEASDVAQR